VQINWNLPVVQWGDDHERAIARSLYNMALAIRPNTGMDLVWEWPHDNKGFLAHQQFGNLRDTRGSFLFDDTGI
jgi:hypothetical protein